MSRSIRDFMDVMVECKTEAEARALVATEIDSLCQADPLLLVEQARATILHNIGYLTGYLDRAEAARLLALFQTRHPYFGAIEDWPDSPEEIMAMGMKVAQRKMREKTRG